MYPDDRRYTKEHEWVRAEDDVVVAGITDFAQHELGDVVFVDLPEIGLTVTAGDELGTIESVKAVAEVYAPVSGEVVEVNEALVEEPEAVNTDPHGGGWLVKIKLSSPDEIDSLMSAAEYEEFAAGEG